MLADPALTIELVAAEPEVTSPVAIAWDEDGRLYVAEMIDYPVAPASGRIRRLEDRDGDGRYEHATVFADGLPFPNGVLPCFGGVLVTAAPNIWFLRDRDGDGRADERSVVLTGFGEGNTQLRVNGLSLGSGQHGSTRPTAVATARSDRRTTRRPRPSRSAAATCGSAWLRRPWSDGFPQAVERRGHRRLQPVRPGARRLGQPLPLVEHDPDPARRARATDAGPQSLPGGDVVGRLDPRPGRRRPDLRDQPGTGAVQSRVGRVLQRQLRADDRARRPAAGASTTATRSCASR